MNVYVYRFAYYSVFLYSIEKIDANRVYCFYFVRVELLHLVGGIYSTADLGLKLNTAKLADGFIKFSELHKFFGMSWETFERHAN